ADLRVERAECRGSDGQIAQPDVIGNIDALDVAEVAEQVEHVGGVADEDVDRTRVDGVGPRVDAYQFGGGYFAVLEYRIGAIEQIGRMLQKRVDLVGGAVQDVDRGCIDVDVVQIGAQRRKYCGIDFFVHDFDVEQYLRIADPVGGQDRFE